MDKNPPLEKKSDFFCLFEPESDKMLLCVCVCVCVCVCTYHDDGVGHGGVVHRPGGHQTGHGSNSLSSDFRHTAAGVLTPPPPHRGQPVEHDEILKHRFIVGWMQHFISAF